MHGLYACIQIPSPLASNGGGQAAFEYVESLSRHVGLDVVSFVAPGRESWLTPLRELVDEVTAVPWRPSYAVRLARWGAASLRAGSWTPFLNRPFLDAVHRRLATHPYDFVQVDWTEVAQQVHVPDGPLFLCGAHDVREKLAARVLERSGRRGDRRRWQRVRREETALFRRADAVLTLSESDARRVRELVPGVPAFPMVYRQAKADPPPPPWDTRETHTLLYVGDFSRRVNARIAEHILTDLLPAVRARAPETRLVLAGGGADAALRRRSRREGVELTGHVPRLDEAYRRATLLLAPIPTGGGVHIKMIEAMSAGLPVLTSTVGNDGVAAEAGRSIVLADTPARMVEEALRLLSHPEHADAVGRAGRDHVLRHFGAEHAAERMRALLAWLDERGRSRVSGW